MTGETLLPCPWCAGHLSITKHFREELWRGVHRCPVIGPITFDWRGSEDEIIAVWNTRALAPALNRVIAEVEAMDDAELAAVSKAYRQSGVAMDMPVGRLQTQILAMLHALRAEQSADAGGEREGGS